MSKRLLIMGATGAMGKYLVKELREHSKYEVYATSRNVYDDNIVHWIKGNAKELCFIEDLIKTYQFDVIVDFMVYSTDEFLERYEFFLYHTSQYIFTSSARVYAKAEDIIDENSPRIIDICSGSYLSNDSYDIAKARQEDLLKKSSYKNWTIIRPSLTYSNRRLQFTIFELNEWIYRVFDHNSIIFPEEMKNIITTMTFGGDVAEVISKLILNPRSFCEIFNVNGGGHQTWGEVLDIYRDALERSLHYKIKVCSVSGAEDIAKKMCRYDQYQYARGINRVFSNEKIESVIGPIRWTSLTEGLTICICQFIEESTIINVPSCKTVAYMDRMANEYTPLMHFNSLKRKMGYLFYRFV